MLLYDIKAVDIKHHQQTIISKADMQINKHCITALIGGNGSGKTTLLNLLALFELPSTGALSYDNTLINAKNYKTLKKNIGYVQQNPYLLHNTVYKNLEIGLKLHHVDKQQRQAKVMEVADTLGISSLLQRSAYQLSGGEIQKVAIGQILILSPEVLILDEPYTHLDKASITEIEQIILKMRDQHNKTIIFTTHQQWQAKVLADDLYHIEDQKIIRISKTNLFYGVLDSKHHQFNTDKLIIHIPQSKQSGEYLSIDANQIVLSKQKMQSSMQNQFQGSIKDIQQQSTKVMVTVTCSGKAFTANISHQALTQLALNVDDQIWLSFKSSAVAIF